MKVAGFFRKIIEYVFRKELSAETARYIIIGVLTTLINVGLFRLLLSIINIDTNIDVTVSNVTSISVSVLFAYIANKLFVFRHRSNSRYELIVEFAKFVGSRLFTMAIEIGSLLVFFNILGYDAWFVKLAVQVVVIAINYIISKMIVFRSTRSR